ncbi:LysR family transcriptional regulator [Pseudorhodoferax sp. Leaf267]|nr:LysR family transcriptional regulator [Pseudorhodoferax sp. Leaf267]
MLRAFEAAGRLGSVTRAAQELNVTQSAVSHQIKELEAWLGVALVTREGRRLALTAQGTAYLPSLSSALDLMAQATARVERQTHRARLTVNALPTLAAQWLIPQLSRFCEQVPDVDVQLVTTAGVLDFDPAAYEVSVRCLSAAELAALQARPGWQGVQFGRFLPDAVTPVCSPAWLARADALKKPADLRRHTLLHSRSTPRLWRQWFGAAGAAAVRPAGELVFDHAHLAVQAAVQGLGIALGSPALVADALRGGLLVAPFAHLLLHEKDFYWMLPARSADDASARAFCDWLQASGAAP